MLRKTIDSSNGAPLPQDYLSILQLEQVDRQFPSSGMG